MKIYRLPELIEKSPEGEYLLGFEELRTCAVYLLYGRLRPKETDRRLSPPEGHEEIICVVKGRLQVKGKRFNVQVGEGEAFHLNGGDTLTIENPYDEEAIYIAAGGSSLEKAQLKNTIQQKAEEKAPAENGPKEEKPQKQSTKKTHQPPGGRKTLNL
jgi:redox-sensitive bicupin YhaK (pirin superfamily)